LLLTKGLYGEQSRDIIFRTRFVLAIANAQGKLTRPRVALDGVAHAILLEGHRYNCVEANQCLFDETLASDVIVW
jgi:hypothetical protein